MFDFDHPFFRPLWIRVAMVTVCLGWAILELFTGSPGWAILFGGAGLYAGYGFFIASRNESPEEEDGPS